MEVQRALDLLISAGWTVRSTAREPVVLPPELGRRFRDLPPDQLAVLGLLSGCVNREENAWFLMADDYSGISKTAFSWNEFELLSLEAAGKDTDWRRAIEGFWDRHFPVLLSVKSGYSYCALNLESDKSEPPVVMGIEPDFEEPTVVADSLSSFLDQLAGHASGERPDSIMRNYV